MSGYDLPPSLIRIGHEIGDEAARKLRDTAFCRPGEPRTCRVYIPKRKNSEMLISRVGVQAFEKMQKRWGGQHLSWSIGRNIDGKKRHARALEMIKSGNTEKEAAKALGYSIKTIRRIMRENNVFRFFKLSEFDCPCCGENEMDNGFVRMLDQARGIAKEPFIITSGYRCSKHNADVGGVKNSSHLAGLGADIAAADSRVRFKVLYGLIKAGFHRIIIYDSHIHVDQDTTKPSEVLAISK